MRVIAGPSLRGRERRGRAGGRESKRDSGGMVSRGQEDGPTTQSLLGNSARGQVIEEEVREGGGAVAEEEG